MWKFLEEGVIESKLHQVGRHVVKSDWYSIAAREDRGHVTFEVAPNIEYVMTLGSVLWRVSFSTSDS